MFIIFKYIFRLKHMRLFNFFTRFYILRFIISFLRLILIIILWTIFFKWIICNFKCLYFLHSLLLKFFDILIFFISWVLFFKSKFYLMWSFLFFFLFCHWFHWFIFNCTVLDTLSYLFLPIRIHHMNNLINIDNIAFI